MDQTGRKKILIADDEQDLREILKMILSAEGYEVVEAENGLQAARLADESIDMYILDVNMPEETGFEAAKKIRARFQAPLLFLTAYSGEADKVNGFLIGADDYIVKPFSNMEMIMRIRAVFRRAEQGTPPAAAREETAEKKGMIPIGDLLLDTESQSLIKDQSVISLTYTEYRILELMAKHRKKIYSLDNIYQSVWGEDAVGDGAIMVHIKNIRKKMGDNSRNPKYIKTAWGRGYYID